MMSAVPARHSGATRAEWESFVEGLALYAFCTRAMLV